MTDDIELGATGSTRMTFHEPPGFGNTAGPMADNAETTRNRTQHEQTTDQGDPLQKLFSMYTAKAAEYDKALWESWNGDMDGIIIFAGLFSTVVASFLIESFKSLEPDPANPASSQQSPIVSHALQNMFSKSPDQHRFHPSASALRVNALWFLSLVFSLMCAFTATLVKQWGRNYLLQVNRHSTAYKRARVRTFLFQGLQRFHMQIIADAVPTLLHISYFLFFIGLAEFVNPVYPLLVHILSCAFTATGLLYAVLTIGPSCCLQFPYQTPFSDILRYLWQLLRRVTAILGQVILYLISTPFILCRSDIQRLRRFISYIEPGDLQRSDLARAREELAVAESPERTVQDHWALKWTMEQLNEDVELEPFIRALLDIVKSPRVRDGHRLLHNLLENGLGRRIVQMIASRSCGGMLDASEEKRAVACMRVVWLSAHWFAVSQWSDELMYSLAGLTKASPPISTWASCTIAVVAHATLSEITLGSWLPERSWFMTARSWLSIDSTLTEPLQLLQLLTSTNGRRLSHPLEQRDLRELRVVQVVRAVSEYLKRPSDPLWRHARGHILEQWTVERELTTNDEYTQLLADLKSTSEHSAQHNVISHNVLNIIGRIVETLCNPICRAEAQSILYSVTPLPDSPNSPPNSAFSSRVVCS